MKQQRLFALVLSLALAAALCVPALAAEGGDGWLVPKQREYSGQFADITAETWCADAVETVYEAGLMEGKTADAFDITADLTHAQILVIAARLHDLLKGGDGTLPAPADGSAWYQPAADYVRDHASGPSMVGWNLQGQLSEFDADPDAYPSQPCTRMEFVVSLSAVVPQAKLPSINAITELPDTNWLDALNFYNAGILTGSNKYGSFNGDDLLNRGQAAAMLARIVDPSQRVTFTPEPLVMPEALLGLAPETPVLTIDGITISADLYSFVLASAIDSYRASGNCADSLSDLTYQDASFTVPSDPSEQDADIAAVDWSVPDKDGLTPARKVQAATLAFLTQLAALMEHQGEFPLTAEDQEYIQTSLDSLQEHSFPFQYTGYTEDTVRWERTCSCLLDNLEAKQIAAITDADTARFLEENECFFGHYGLFLRGGPGYYSTDADALAGVENMQAYYKQAQASILELYFWDMFDYDFGPSLIELSLFPEANRAALKEMQTGASQIITLESCYMLVIKLDPSGNEDLRSTAGKAAAAAQLDNWVKSAEVKTTAAYDTLDMVKIITGYEALHL